MRDIRLTQKSHGAGSGDQNEANDRSSGVGLERFKLVLAGSIGFVVPQTVCRTILWNLHQDWLDHDVHIGLYCAGNASLGSRISRTGGSRRRSSEIFCADASIGYRLDL